MRIAPPSFTDYSAEFNGDIRLLPHDRLLAATLFRVWPYWFTSNWLTLIRLMLVSPIIYVLGYGHWLAGTILFVLAALTDAIDGSLARTRKQISRWGIIGDPLADKLLIGGVVLTVVLEYMNFWIGLCLLMAEVVIVLVNWRQMRRGQVKPANFWGKIKMVCEVAGVLVLLLALASGVNMLIDVSAGTFCLAIAFAIVAALARVP